MSDGTPKLSRPEGHLVEVLTRAQALGFLGDRSIGEVIEHARHFARALPVSCRSVVDLGSGGGVPGLVIAFDRPEAQLTLVERRQSRADELRRSVGALRLGDRVQVWDRDAADLAVQRFRGHDAAVSRGFGPPAATLTMASRLVRPGGVIIISEPPQSTADRWPPDLLRACGVSRLSTWYGPVVAFEVLGEIECRS